MNGSVHQAGRHALGWLVAANAVGLWLSLLLVHPQLQAGEWTYGRWVPVHLNGQLYGWTSLPLVAWLFKIYGVDRRWAEVALWAWTGALALGCLGWLQGGSSGKVFLDWSGGPLVAFAAAMGLLWVALWRGKSGLKPVLRWAGLIALAPVPWMMVMASSPDIYPPVDPTTGGPLGSSLLGSTLFVVGLMLMLPATLAERCRKGRLLPVMVVFGLSWAAFAAAEAAGGSHRDWWQIGSMLLLVPWLWLLPKWWAGYDWPEGSGAWRMAMFGWWALLVLSGVTAYFPEVLDRLKFTQGLVAHSHLAMAGFTTSFCACLLTLLGVKVGGVRSVLLWNGAALVMVIALMTMGWMESGGYGWMAERPWWRATGMGLRTLCGIVMLGVSVRWWMATGQDDPATERQPEEVMA